MTSASHALTCSPTCHAPCTPLESPPCMLVLYLTRLSHVRKGVSEKASLEYTVARTLISLPQVSSVTLSFLSHAPSAQVTFALFSFHPCLPQSPPHHAPLTLLPRLRSYFPLPSFSAPASPRQVPRWIASYSAAPATVPVIPAAIVAANPFPFLPAALKPLPFSALPAAATATAAATTLAPLTTSLPLSPPSSAHLPPSAPLPPPPFSNLPSSASAYTFLRPRATYAVERAVPDANNPFSPFPVPAQHPGSFICHPPFFPGYPPPFPPTLLAAASADAAATATAAATAAALPSFADASPLVVRPRPRNATVSALPRVTSGESEPGRMMSDDNAALHGANPAAFDDAGPVEVAAAAAGAELGAHELSAIRAVMMRHEAAFRAQVADLHAICAVQRGLMTATMTHPSDEAPGSAAADAACKEAPRGERKTAATVGRGDAGNGDLRGDSVGGEASAHHMAEQDSRRRKAANRAGALLFDLEQLPGNDEGEEADEGEEDGGGGGERELMRSRRTRFVDRVAYAATNSCACVADAAVFRRSHVSARALRRRSSAAASPRASCSSGGRNILRGLKRGQSRRALPRGKAEATNPV
ncbi:unnamed protein product [Closterium sp. Yama58-4]|nr:unnamed protein product [Closterium sp. Yama58-4]